MKITESRAHTLLLWLDGMTADHTLRFEEMTLFRDAAALIRQLQAAEQAAWHAGLDAGREQGGGDEHRRAERLAEALQKLIDHGMTTTADLDMARAAPHPTAAPLQAEIETLRADIEAWKESHSMLTDTCHHFQARAERLKEALLDAEAALADIGDADREPGDDLAWCERRAAQALPTVRAALKQEAGQ